MLFSFLAEFNAQLAAETDAKIVCSLSNFLFEFDAKTRHSYDPCKGTALLQYCIA
jgi:hypothetical protein